MSMFSYRARAPYYNERYATWIRKHLQKILDNPTCDLRFSLKAFNVTANTLIQKINQAWLYLIETKDLDPEGKFKKLRENMRVHNELSHIAIRWKREADERERVNETELVDKKFIRADPDRIGWKQILEEFIDNAEEGAELEEKNLRLNEKDWIFINTICMSAGDMVVDYLGKSGYKVIKNTELAEVWREEQ